MVYPLITASFLLKIEMGVKKKEMKSTTTCCPKHCFYSTTHWIDVTELQQLIHGIENLFVSYFKLSTAHNDSLFPLVLLQNPHRVSWWKSFHPPFSSILRVNHSPSHSVTSCFLCVTHGCQGCTNTKRHARKQTRRDQYVRLIKQWHKQSRWILLLVICWCIWISPSLKE